MQALFTAFDISTLTSSVEVLIIAFIQVGLLFVGMRYIRRVLLDRGPSEPYRYGAAENMGDTRLMASRSWYGKANSDGSRSNQFDDY